MLEERVSAQRRRARRRGWGPLALLAPQVALGAWLAIVPDRLAFTAAQLVVLAHVAVALATLPPFLLWVLRHGYRRPVRPSGSALASVARHGLAVLAFLAFASGLATLSTSDGMPRATLHAALGLAPSVPLALHLFLDGRRFAAGVVAASLLAVLASSFAFRETVAGPPPVPPAPAFAFATRPTKLYDPAAWCGECHVATYDEWRRSTHALTLGLPRLRREYQDQARANGAAYLDNDLAAVGAGTVRNNGLCVHCHAPTTFYGDDPAPVLAAAAPVADGVTCSFCHTLRGIRPRQVPQKVPQQELGFYLSAPESVSRYFGQAASNRVARALGNWLIRWRPQMHRRDYHAPFLDGSEACRGCHGMLAGPSYDDWAASPYNPTDGRPKVLCQDCHMSEQMTARPVVQPGALVPWGPERRQRRTHLFLGGNAQASLEHHDWEVLERQRDMHRRSLGIAVEDARREGTHVLATVIVRNEHVGHLFPSMESSQRSVWVELRALDAAGRERAATRPPTDPRPGVPSPLIYRSTDPKTGRVTDTTIAPHQERAFAIALDLGDAAKNVTRVRAVLRNTFDSQPLADVTVDLATTAAADPR